MATLSPPTLAMSSNPTTPAFSNAKDWFTAYLAIHMLSDSSRRYSFLLWITIVLIVLVFSILHWTGSRGGYFGALWSKWSLRRRTWRKKHALAASRRKNQPHRQPLSLPSNAQLLCLGLLFLAAITLSVAGPDYIAPGVKVWQFYGSASTPMTSTAYEQPQYTIWKAWWTSGGRIGQIAFALLPLCVLFALKAPPFAIFAIPFMVQLHFDKLAYLHRWCGRLIWLLSAAHVALWTVQLVRDSRQTTGRMAFVYAWQEMKFIWGWIAFGVLTFIIAFSIHPLRREYYEAFYFLHIWLVPLFIVAAAFHHPPVWWWCWAALALWIGERLWRGTWWLYNNGYFGGMSSSPPANRIYMAPGKQDNEGPTWQMHVPQDFNTHAQLPKLSTDFYSQRSSFLSEEQPLSHSPQAQYPMRSIYHPPSSSTSLSLRIPLSTSSSYVPPPGYAHAELLAGRTVRLRFISPGFLSWAPGQHFIINIPSVSKFTSHPFTVASVYDHHGPDSERIMVQLIRAKNGWTKDLWDTVVKLTINRESCPHGEHPNKGSNMPTRGILMRMYVDGPFGSSVRARWGTHSTVLVIAGGTGVSFGLSVLEYMCKCLSGRDGRDLGGRPGGWGKKGFVTSRLRFVWLVREFSHIQWGATILRRCMAMVPLSDLQIDIFVTNFMPLPPTVYDTTSSPAPSQQLGFPYDGQKNDLAYPNPTFAQNGDQSHISSQESLDAADYDIDLSYYAGNHDEINRDHEEQEPADLFTDHETHILDLTNFDGDIDGALPGEDVINRTVKKQGTLRRAQTRKATLDSLAAKEKLHEKRADADNYAQLRILGTRNHNGRTRTHISTPSNETYLSTDRLLSNTAFVHSGIEHQSSVTREVDQGLAVLDSGPDRLASGTPTPPVSSHVSRHSYSEQHFSNRDSKPDITSVYEITLPALTGVAGEELRLEIGEQEMQDISVVSEHARPGKPKLDVILAEEVESSKGSTIVACCGPTSLCAMVRKIIAAKIDPARIRRGDMRGTITLVSEEFKY